MPRWPQECLGSHHVPDGDNREAHAVGLPVAGSMLAGPVLP